MNFPQPKLLPQDSRTQTYELLFSTYKNIYPCWPFLCLAICLSFIGIIGMFLNFCVIYVTVKSKSLRSTSNFLLAFTSIFEFFHQSGHFLILFTSISGINFLHFPLAIRLSTISLFGVFGIAPLMLFTGIDRLLCVTFPILYKTMHRFFYLCAILSFTSAFSLALLALQFNSSDQFANLKVPGVIGDLFQGYGGDIHVKISFSLNAITIFIYLFVGIIIRRQCDPKSCTRDQHFSRRIFRTLFTLISLNMGGYLLIFSFYAFAYDQIEGGNLTVWFVEQFFGILVNISASSSAIVLYFTSTDYRKVFRTEFSWFFKLTNSIHQNEIKIQPPVNKRSIISLIAQNNPNSKLPQLKLQNEAQIYC